jgi:muconolactone delta-isomerase
MERHIVNALFLVISTPRPERPSEVAAQRLDFWPWIGRYEAAGVCKHIYARVGRGAAAVFDVESNDQLHRILNQWTDIIPAEFDVYPLVDIEATRKLLAAQVAGNKTS